MQGVFHWNNSALKWWKCVRFRRVVRISSIEACFSTIFDLFYNNIFQFQWACVHPRLYNISQVSVRVRYVSVDSIFAPFWCHGKCALEISICSMWSTKTTNYFCYYDNCDNNNFVAESICFFIKIIVLFFYSPFVVGLFDRNDSHLRLTNRELRTFLVTHSYLPSSMPFYGCIKSPLTLDRTRVI